MSIAHKTMYDNGGALPMSIAHKTFIATLLRLCTIMLGFLRTDIKCKNGITLNLKPFFSEEMLIIFTCVILIISQFIQRYSCNPWRVARMFRIHLLLYSFT